MKKILVCLLMLIISADTAFAQIKFKASTYVSPGVCFWNKFSINEHLNNNNLVPINTTMPQILLGLNAEFNRMYFSMEYGFMSSRKVTDNYGYKFLSFNLNTSASYTIFNKESWQSYIGIVGSYIPASLQVLSKQSAINVAEINPSGQSGAIILNNSFWSIGPSVGANLFSQSSVPLFFVVSYEKGISNNIWKSEYATLSNSPEEKGNDRLTVKMIIPVRKWSIK